MASRGRGPVLHLKVCAPPVFCVEAGLLEAPARKDYSAMISLDGNSVEFSWESDQFDLVYDDDGQLIGCPPNGRDRAAYVLHRAAQLRAVGAVAGATYHFRADPRPR